MKTRHSTVEWIGDLTDGGGQVSTESGAMQEVPFGFGSRFLDAPGSNPEELLAAAHGSCFATHLGLLLAKQGTPAETLDIGCKVHLRQVAADRVEFASSSIDVRARIANLSDEMFQKIVAEAIVDCPLSRAFRIDVAATGTLV